MSGAELTLLIKPKSIGEDPYIIEADADERSALAARFGLSELEALRAELILTPKGTAISADGKICAKWLQQCAVSGEDFPVCIEETLHFRFVPAAATVTDEEIELEREDLDEVEYNGASFDLGEAVAQSLGLAIDPYATGPNAEQVRKEKGIAAEGEQDGPLAEMLSALKRD